jgi:pimeloyl-ACP methyl ester carboxylesterase
MPYTDDHLGLMDHLGIGKFMVMGFCIGGPFIWNLPAALRIVSSPPYLRSPSGSRPEMRDFFLRKQYEGLGGRRLVKRRPELTDGRWSTGS